MPEICNTSRGNTGTPACDNLMSSPYKAVLVPSDHSFATEAAAAIEANWTALINNTADTSRGYPTPAFEGTNPVNEDVVEQEGDYRTFWIKYGKRQDVYTLLGVPFCQLKRLSEHNNTKQGVYIIDALGQIIGRKPTGGVIVYPFTVNSIVFDIPQLATQEAVVTSSARWQYTIPEEWYDAVVISPAAGFSPKELDGLNDITVTAGSPSAGAGNTTVVITYASQCGGDDTAIGLIITDWVLYNINTSLVVVIGSLTDNADGTYDLVYPDETAAHVLRLTTAKNGYDFGDPITFIQP